jgi:hypothetical protein
MIGAHRKLGADAYGRMIAMRNCTILSSTRLSCSTKAARRSRRTDRQSSWRASSWRMTGGASLVLAASEYPRPGTDLPSRLPAPSVSARARAFIGWRSRPTPVARTFTSPPTWPDLCTPELQRMCSSLSSASRGPRSFAVRVASGLPLLATRRDPTTPHRKPQPIEGYR